MLLLNLNPNYTIIVISAILTGLAIPIATKSKTKNTFSKRYSLMAKISLVLIVAVCLLSIWNEKSNSAEKNKSDKKIAVIDSNLNKVRKENASITTKLDMMGLYYKNGEFFPTNAIARALVKEMNRSEVKDSTFSTNFNSKVIREYIIKHTSLKYAKNSSLLITIGYKGEIEKMDNGLYKYPGGVVDIKIEKIKKIHSVNLMLKETYRWGAPLPVVEKNLENQLTNIIATKPEIIAKAIVECIR